MLIEATLAGDFARVQRLVGEGAALEARDPARRTALLIATRSDHVDIARALIEAGADVNAKDNIRDTPFLYAGAEGRNEILRAILATGRANFADTNRYGGTALIPAAHHGHPETVKLLIEAGLDLDHVNRLGWTALMEAVILGDGGPIYQAIVGLLVDAGATASPTMTVLLRLSTLEAVDFAQSKQLSPPRPGDLLAALLRVKACHTSRLNPSLRCRKS